MGENYQQLNTLKLAYNPKDCSHNLNQPREERTTS